MKPDELIFTTQKLALNAGAKRYFTGKSCLNGHIDERYSYNGSCVSCAAEKSEKWRKSLSGKLWKDTLSPERLAEYTRRCYLKNKDKYHARSNNYRAKKKSAFGKYTVEQVEQLMKNQNNKCANCMCAVSKNPIKKEAKAHLDHIMPLKLGGSNLISNLQFLCKSCNLRKNAIHPLEWARINERLI